MKFSTLLDMLTELLLKRQVTAKYLAKKYDLSPRTVYRYVEILATAVPVQIKRGRAGGIYLSDSYKLPLGFFTKEEYEAIIEALNDAYARQPEAKFLEARRKLSAQEKTEFSNRFFRTDLEDFLLHESSLTLPPSAMDKLRIVGACIRSLHILEVEYEQNGKRVSRKIEPHLLLFQDNHWHVYAFCHTERSFQLFALSHFYSLRQIEENFKKRPFEHADVPTMSESKEIPVRLEISKSALPSLKKWLGVENIKLKNGKWIADAPLQNNEQLVRKLLSYGGGIKILSPAELKRKIKTEAEKIIKNYE